MFFINLSYTGTPKYSLGRFCEYNNDLYDTITSYFLERVPFLPVKGYLTITSDLERRPDLISYKLYGDTQYWWIIMFYNGIIDINDLRSGITIKYPDLVDLENLYLSLKPMELARS